jgi:RNA polymerase sigma-70 factor (ECF subfamily)
MNEVPARVGEKACETAVLPTFDQVYAAYFPFVWRSVRRLGICHATDDVVQEIFVVVHRRLPTFEGRASVKTWLFRIALRVVRDHRRMQRRREPHTRSPDCAADPESVSADPTARPDEVAAKTEGWRTLHALLDSLDDEKREVFVLAELEQMTAPEIAEATGEKLNTVYSRLRLARQAFEEAVARHQTRDGWRLK